MGRDSYEHSRNALDAAIKLHGALSEGLFADHSIIGLEPLALGIGIDQGPVLLVQLALLIDVASACSGILYSTVLRLQEMTAELAQPILIGAASARHLSDRNLQSQGELSAPGLQCPMFYSRLLLRRRYFASTAGNIDAA